GTNNPTGIWDIYALGVTQNSDGGYYPTYGTWDWIRMGQWKIDLTPPNATVSDPVYNPDSTFSISYGASDTFGIKDVVNYITRLDSSAGLRDNTLGQDLLFDFAPNVHKGSVNLSNYLSFSNRNYRDISSSSGNEFNFRLDVIDLGCNEVSVSTNAIQPMPWVMTYQGNLSVNGNTIVDDIIKNIHIPDLSTFNISGLPGFNYIDGVNGPYFTTYS